MELLIGRKEEQKILREALASRKAEMIAIIGRRRIGKTFLVKSTFNKHIIFRTTGTQDGPENEQIRNFVRQIGIKENIPTNWNEAFYALEDYLKEQDLSEKKVLFFDELPWLAASSEAFLRALSFFWNNWAADQNLVVVLCGSASSWIIQKVINHKGGLHNRVTRHIRLKPFTLKETEELLRSKTINFTPYQITFLYMALGGVPLYWGEVKDGQSASQNIERICFSESGLLKKEFLNLYPALFEDAHQHIKVVRALAKTWKGLSQDEIKSKTKIEDEDDLLKILQELEESDFIMSYFPYTEKEENKIYRLIDEYSLLYLKFIERKAYQGRKTWSEISKTQKYKIWSGYAYEGICMKHQEQLKRAMDISAYTLAYSFLKKGTKTEKGFQIDMFFDRSDEVINLFEVKFYKKEFVLTKEYAAKLQERKEQFKKLTKTKKQVFLTLITTYGLKQNAYSKGVINQVVVLDELFR